jgi:type IV pilus assembly protein PilE
MKMLHRYINGFQLLELLITLMIVSILATIGFSAYTQHVTAARRLQATQALSKLALAMEKFHFEHQGYRGVSLAELGLDERTADGKYRLEIAMATDEAYLLAAVPKDNKEETITLPS